MHSESNLDNIDRKLLNLIQAEFPLNERPYTELGLRLGIDGSEIIQRIEQFKQKGLIRQISPVVDSRSLGYESTLAAMRVEKEHLAEAERIISEHPGVSHGYERDHYFNVWFTLATAPEADIEAEFRRLVSPIQAAAAFTLPAIKLFKINVYFDMTGDGNGTHPTHQNTLFRKIALSETEKTVLKELQQDLPLVPSPFTVMAANLDMDVADFLARCQSLLERGAIRRYGASLNHRRAGFTANAMVCWAAPPDMVDTVGQKLASLQEVSHCYERRTNPLWRHNLFAMVHSHTKEACQEIAERVSHEVRLNDYLTLFSTREFKKTRVKYQA
ncbi:MAG: Lrp/AsnC family transcriptional regulator [Chloroflexi bacterium]|nr:Lrp/AsnC family transcriptional regulator [Chloroflexota bacterium]